jgi:hypothetical protein
VFDGSSEMVERDELGGKHIQTCPSHTNHTYKIFAAPKVTPDHTIFDGREQQIAFGENQRWLVVGGGKLFFTNTAKLCSQ